MTQARAMCRRGDLCKSTFTFDVQLSQPIKPPCLGMDMTRTSKAVDDQSVSESRRPGRFHSFPSALHTASLQVVEIDQGIKKLATPVAEWNLKEKRYASRGPNERRASLEIKPGDIICAVNGKSKDDDALLDELVTAASITSPKALNLRLERLVPDVMKPSLAYRSSSFEMEEGESEVESRLSAGSSRSSSSSEACSSRSSDACSNRYVRCDLARIGQVSLGQDYTPPQKSNSTCRDEAACSIQKLLHSLPICKV